MKTTYVIERWHIGPDGSVDHHDVISQAETRMEMNYEAVKPDSEQKEWPGRRLRILRMDQEDQILLFEETVLPEKVNLLNAYRMRNHEQIILDKDDARWLRDRLNELLA